MIFSVSTSKRQAVLAGLSALTLVLAIVLPHHHDRSAGSHPESTCRACRIQEGFTATPVTTPVVSVQPLLVVSTLRGPSQAPRVHVVLRYASPRAPPTLS